MPEVARNQDAAWHSAILMKTLAGLGITKEEVTSGEAYDPQRGTQNL